MKVLRLSGPVALALVCLGLTTSIGVQGQPEGGVTDGSGVAVRGVVIPTGYRQGQFSTLVQIVVDGSPLPGATWDVEASLVVQGTEPKDVSGRITVGEAGIPAVLEAQMTFIPGSYELMLAARETTAGQNGTGRLRGRWPDPDRKPATVCPVAILQPAQAAFVRGGTPRDRGAMARGLDDPVRIDLPAAVVCLVCRGRNQEGSFRIERELAGSTEVEFDPIQLELGEERCAQVRDLIPPGTMTEGFFTYEVRVLDDNNEEIASGSREFSAAGPGASQENRPSS